MALSRETGFGYQWNVVWFTMNQGSVTKDTNVGFQVNGIRLRGSANIFPFRMIRRACLRLRIHAWGEVDVYRDTVVSLCAFQFEFCSGVATQQRILQSSLTPRGTFRGPSMNSHCPHALRQSWWYSFVLCQRTVLKCLFGPRGQPQDLSAPELHLS